MNDFGSNELLHEYDDEEIPQANEDKEDKSVAVWGLGRPFMVGQLKDLLEQSGKVEQFWINKIKSHCFVTVSKLTKKKV